MPYLQNNEPLCVLWIGNFFKPEYDDEKAMEKALSDIKKMGFNGFVLDSKQWLDFDLFYKGGEPSRYVKMQMFAVSKGEETGLMHMFLSLYFNGDNLYAEGLREAPPVYGEEASGLDGKGLRSYKYWSLKAQESMAYHVKSLIASFRKNHAEVLDDDGEAALPVITMFDPWILPSFDGEGRDRYVSWLKGKYKSIGALNERYKSSFADFSGLKPEDYWYAARSYANIKNLPPVEYPGIEEAAASSPDYLKFVDNQLWRQHEYGLYFRSMEQKLRSLPDRLYIMPILNQWKLFFASGRSAYWKSSARALDPWTVAPYMDSVTFNTLPADAVSDPNAYVVSAETSIMRSASRTGDFTAGIDICRFIDNDVYRYVSPAETIASTLLNGAQGLHAYGYNGLDDGGSLKRMPQPLLDNVGAGLRWFKAAAKMIKGKTRKKEIALLYPRWMSILSPDIYKSAAEEKYDFLGWFQYLCDQGYHIDVIHPEQIIRGGLSDYPVLVLPWEPYYRFDRSSDLEAAIENWVGNGGTLIHGSGCEMLTDNLDAAPEMHIYESIKDKVYLLPSAYVFETYAKGEPLVFYNSGKPAAVLSRFGKGSVLSNGFNPGLSYIKREQPFSAGGVGINEVYQFCILDSTYLSGFLNSIVKPVLKGVRGLEQAVFGDITVAVNHNPYPVNPELRFSEPLWMLEGDGPRLSAHGAVIGRLPETDTAL